MVGLSFPHADRAPGTSKKMKRNLNEISHDDLINDQTLHNDEHNDPKKIKISNGTGSTLNGHVDHSVVANFCDDIVYCILSFVDFVTRVRCSILSRQWMDAPFKTLTLGFGKKTIDLAQVAKCSYLQTIETLKLRPGLFENGDKLLGSVHLGNLKALDLSHSIPYRKINGHWRFVFSFNCRDDGSYPALANLTSLNLGSSGLKSEAIVKLLQHTRMLKTLSMEENLIDDR